MSDCDHRNDIQTLIAQIHSSDFAVRSAAVNSLVAIGSPAVELLIEALNSEDSVAIRATVEALGRIGDPRGVEPLGELLKSQNNVTRYEVALALGEIKDGSAVRFLEQLSQEDRDRRVRSAAVSALSQYGIEPEMRSGSDDGVGRHVDASGFESEMPEQQRTERTLAAEGPDSANVESPSDEYLEESQNHEDSEELCRVEADVTYRIIGAGRESIRPDDIFDEVGSLTSRILPDKEIQNDQRGTDLKGKSDGNEHKQPSVADCLKSARIEPAASAGSERDLNQEKRQNRERLKNHYWTTVRRLQELSVQSHHQYKNMIIAAAVIASISGFIGARIIYQFYYPYNSTYQDRGLWISAIVALIISLLCIIAIVYMVVRELIPFPGSRIWYKKKIEENEAIIANREKAEREREKAERERELHLKELEVRRREEQQEQEMRARELRELEKKEAAERLKVNSEKDKMAGMSGWEFERFVAEVYEKLGYSVDVTPGSGDEGVDILMYRTSEKIAVQCKRHSQPIGQRHLRELLGATVHAGADRAIFVTNSTYSQKAKEFVEGKSIELVDGEDLAGMAIQAANSVTLANEDS